MASTVPAKKKRDFNPEQFLATIGQGRKVASFPKKQTIEKRLARTLLLLAHFGKEGVPETVVPRISQETLAEMVGTNARGSVSS